MAEVKVGYSQGAKVTSPQNQYENATFTVSNSLTFEYDEQPEGVADIVSWESILKERMRETTAFLRAEAEAELQKDIDQFKKDNGG